MGSGYSGDNRESREIIWDRKIMWDLWRWAYSKLVNEIHGDSAEIFLDRRQDWD